MKPKQINISEEKVSLVTEIFEKEHGRWWYCRKYTDYVDIVKIRMEDFMQ